LKYENDCLKFFRYGSENGEIHSEFFSPAIDHKMQMIIIGDRNVGKTCFLERYTDDKFTEDSKSTIGKWITTM